MIYKHEFLEYTAVLLMLASQSDPYDNVFEIPDSDKYAAEALYEMLGQVLGKDSSKAQGDKEDDN